MLKGKKEKNKEKKIIDKSQIFVKIMAGCLVLIMVVASGATIIYSLI